MSVSLKKVLQIFSDKQLARVKFTLAIALIAALFEVVGIAMIMPFIEIVSNSSAITESSIHTKIYEFSGVDSRQSYIVFFGGLTLVSIFASTSIVALSKYKINKLIWDLNYEFTDQTFLWYLKKEYSFYLQSDTAIISKNIHNEIGILINGFLLPLSKVLTNGTTIIFILALLFYVAPVGVMVALPILVISYYAVYRYSDKSITHKGQARLLSHNVMHKILKEVTTGIKTIKINDKASVFKSIFDRSLKEYSEANVYISLLSELPRYLIEFLMFTVVIGFILASVILGGGLADALPTLALFAVASIRMLPYGQQMYSSLTRVKYNYPSFQELSVLLAEVKQGVERKAVTGTIIDPKVSIEIKDVTFRYPDTDRYIFKNVDAEIKIGKWLGVSGHSGSGKSTLLDVFMGLLEPSSGSIMVDGNEINEQDAKKLRELCSYLPQKSFLFNGTIKQNVAFEYEDEKIDDARVLNALQEAGLGDYVAGLDDGIDNFVGDSGVMLSGGQSQRIGIARSLYSGKNILIFDESTSALDSVSENLVYSKLLARGGLTLITVTHDHSILKQCDYLLYVDGAGKVLNGSYEELVASSEEFSTLSKA